MTEVIDPETGEVWTPDHNALAVRSSAAPANLLGTDEPAQFVEGAAKAATALADVIRQKKLFKTSNDKQHVLVEAWTMLGAMLGVFPVIVWTRPLTNEAGQRVGWEARCEARTRAGEIVGAAEAECRKNESIWKNRDSYALRSMAQTRATSKALRGPLGFIIQLAGYNATPAEELDGVERESRNSGGGSKPRKASQAQHAKITALLEKLEQEAPPADGQKLWRDDARDQAGVASLSELMGPQASKLIDWLQTQLDAAGVPF